MNQLEKALETEKDSSAKDDVNTDVQNKLELLGILNKMQQVNIKSPKYKKKIQFF